MAASASGQNCRQKELQAERTDTRRKTRWHFYCKSKANPQGFFYHLLVICLPQL